MASEMDYYKAARAARKAGFIDKCLELYFGSINQNQGLPCVAKIAEEASSVFGEKGHVLEQNALATWSKELYAKTSEQYAKQGNYYTAAQLARAAGLEEKAKHFYLNSIAFSEHFHGSKAVINISFEAGFPQEAIALWRQWADFKKHKWLQSHKSISQ